MATFVAKGESLPGEFLETSGINRRDCTVFQNSDEGLWKPMQNRRKCLGLLCFSTSGGCGTGLESFVSEAAMLNLSLCYTARV